MRLFATFAPVAFALTACAEMPITEHNTDVTAGQLAAAGIDVTDLEPHGGVCIKSDTQGQNFDREQLTTIAQEAAVAVAGEILTPVRTSGANGEARESRSVRQAEAGIEALYDHGIIALARDFRKTNQIDCAQIGLQLPAGQAAFFLTGKADDVGNANRTWTTDLTRGYDYDM